MTDLLIDAQPHLNGAIKALGERRFGGYLVRFNEVTPDLHREHFSKATDFMIGNYKLIGDPALFHHGLDASIGVVPIGEVESVEKREDGLYIECRLNFTENMKAYAAGLEKPAEWVSEQERMAQEYEEYIWRWIQQGETGFSSGALPQSVEINAKTGHIDRWAIIEATVTRAEADPRRTLSEAGLSPNDGTRITPLKSLSPVNLMTATKEATTPEEEQSTQAAGDLTPIDNQTEVTDETPVTEETKMNPLEGLRDLLMQLLEQLNMQLTPTEVPVVEPAMEAAMEEEYAKADSPEELDEEQTKAILKAAVNVITQHRASQKAFVSGFAEELRSTPGTPKAKYAGAYTNGSTGNGGNVQAPAYVPNARIKSKYGNLKPEVISCLLDLENQRRSIKHMSPFKPGGVDEGIGVALQVLANHTVEAFDNGALYYNGDHYSKALEVRGMKANEIDHTTQSNFGADWIWTLWRNQIIEKARRENVIMPQFKTIVMEAATEIHPVEWTDPTPYYVPETTSDANIDPSTSNTPLSKLGTENLTFTTRKLALRTGWSAEQQEDSIIAQAERAQTQSDRAIRDAMDYILVSGDTTNANTNINYSGGSPNGDERWLVADGLMHLPLIVGSGLAVDNATAGLLLTKIREARFSLGSEFNTALDDIVMFTDSQTYQQMLNLDEFLTMDKAGALATAQKGQLGFIDGIPVFVSSQIGLSHTNGKISSTSNENIYGRIVFMYKPYWYLGIRRQITPKLAESADGESWQLHLSARMTVQTNPHNNGASLLYGINV